MKLFVVLCLVVASQANILHDLEHVVDKVGDGVKDAANTVAGGVKDAAHTVVDGVDTAAHAVGGALSGVGHTLDGSFGEVWNVVKDPLEQAGKQILIQAGTFALEQGITLALNALAAGKREATDPKMIKAYLVNELTDEYSKWLSDMEHNILGSKDEMEQALSKATAVNDMPEELKKYVLDFTDSLIKGQTSTFVNKQADKAMKDGIQILKTRLQDRLFNAINALAAN